MKQKHLDKFLNLKALELAQYTNKELVHYIDDSFINFFLANENKLDDPHKEMSLFLISNLTNPESFNILLRYIDYPVAYVMWVARSSLMNYKDLPDNVVLAILDILLRRRYEDNEQSKKTRDFDRQFLLPILDKSISRKVITEIDKVKPQIIEKLEEKAIR